MPYSAEHRRRTRRRIVESAGRVVRQQGALGAGVDAIMAGAGLTSGGFYAHFRKKDSLLAEIVGGGIDRLRQGLFTGLGDVRGVPFLAAIARRYLSRSHRNDVENGCVMVPLMSEVPRLGPEVRAAFEDGFDDFVARLTPNMPASAVLSSRDRTLATLALFAGGVMLARAVEDPELSDQILTACRRLAVPEAYTPRGAAKGER